MAKICVTGANGFLGSWLVKELVHQGHKVRVLVREGSDRSSLVNLGLDVSYGDILNPASLDQAFQNQEAVFHLAGLIAYKSSDRQKMEAINATGTQNVVQAIQKTGVARLIHMSSVACVGAGFSPSEILNENSKYNLEHLNLGYFETKRKAELFVRDAVDQKKIDAVIVNPSTIYGAGDAKKGSRSIQLKVARGKMPIYPLGGVSIVGVEDCVHGIIQAWHKGKSGERYILSGQNISVKELFEMISKVAGVRPPTIGLSRNVLLAAGSVGDFLGNFGLSSPVSRETAWTSSLYHWFDSSKAQRELGFRPSLAYPAIEKSVTWIKENLFH